VLGPAAIELAHADEEDCTFVSHCKDSRSSRGMPIYFDSRFERSRIVGEPPEPDCPTSHHLLDGLPLELDSSGTPLALILAIGDNDGMYPFHHVDSGRPFCAGEAILEAEEGVESECDAVCKAGRLVLLGRCSFMAVGRSPENDPDEFRCDLEYGRNKSRVSSNISEPIASMADAYFSRLIRDSLTIKSANMRTRSSSFSA
jgi:hypothetical protein